MARNSKNLIPTVVKQVVFNTEELSRRADPEWVKDRNYMPAYKFDRGRRKFVDHRDRVYNHPEADE
jgi:hypothetical protein